MTTDKATQPNAMTPQEFSKHMAYNTKMEHKMESVHRMMAAYHQHQLTAIRAELAGLKHGEVVGLRKEIEMRLDTLDEVLAIIDKHIKP